MIVRWGLDELPEVLDELFVSEPLLIASARWQGFDLAVTRRFHGVRPHAEVAGVQAARDAAAGADGLVALGGGNAIDTAKAVSSETGLPIVSIPTTYSGAEWTQGFGMRDREAGVKRGGGGAKTVAIVSPGRGDETDEQALGGRYGLAHGTMNAVCLPPALGYNRDAAAEEIATFGQAMGRGDAIERVRELDAFAGPAQLRAYDVPREDLGPLSEAIAERAPAKANPRPAPPDAIRELLEEIW